jgi:3-oxoacyl-[acyl-carrier protein] reductase
MSKNILIFGVTGSVGSHVYESFKKLDHAKYNVIGTSSKLNNKLLYVTNDNLTNLNTINNLDIIVWCNGCNINDNIYNFNEEDYLNVMNININFIIKTLNFLLKNNKVNNSCKMVIVSSIWEKYVRENKLSYTVSKSALGGLVRSLSCDLSDKNILINNILPGVIDNEMSQKTLSREQIYSVKNHLKFDRLINLDDIFKTIKFLTLDNSAITGESIKIDLGFTTIKKI